MDMTVHFNNLDSSDAIKSYVETKIGRIKKHFEEPVSAQITLSVEKLNHIVKVNLNAHGYLVHVEEKDSNLYTAIDLVSDILERKIKKYIDKIKKKKNKSKGGSKGVVVNEEIISLAEPDRSDKQVIKVKNYEIKPMDVEEAAMQMDLLNRGFLVFLNPDTDAVNVIYKRKDDNYGLIETRAK